MSELIKVGMAELKVCIVPDTITTLGLGSCVGVALRDKTGKVGGLAHVMLPDSTQIRNNTNLAKFADTGIEELVKQMVAKGANSRQIVAKIAGGAEMFQFHTKSDVGRVGERNAEACKKKLTAMRIPVLAEDTGGSHGRTVTFDPESGEFTIKIIGKPLRTI